MTDIYRGKDTPIFIGSTFIKRAVEFNVSRRQRVVNVSEVNTNSYVGVIVSPAEYVATLRILEVGQGVWNALGLTTGWQSYIQSDPSGIASIGATNGALTTAVVTGFDVRANAYGAAEAVFTLLGTGWTTIGTSAPAPDTSLLPKMAGDCSLSIGSKVQNVRISAGASVSVVREVNDTTARGFLFSAPWAEIEIECIHPGVCDWIGDEASAIDIALQVGDLTFTVLDCVSAEEPHIGNIRGWTTNIYRYRSTVGNITFSF